MLSKVTLANELGEDVVIHEDVANGRRVLVDAKGLVGVGPLRSSKRVLPQAHGSINETAFEEGRTVQLTGEVMVPGSIENALAEFRKVSQVFLESVDNGGALLKWTEGSAGLKLQMTVELDSECEPILHDAAAFVQYTASLFAEDPRAYAQELTTKLGAGITGVAPEEEWIADPAIRIAVDASHIYWVDGSSHFIGRAAIAGTSIEREWLSVGGPAYAVAVDATHIYWGAGGKVGRATIAGASIETTFIATNPATAVDIAVNGSNIYLALGTNRIARAAIGGGSYEASWMTLPSSVDSLAIDASHIYFSQRESGAIGRATLAGGTIEAGWIAGNAVSGLVVSASFVYWASEVGLAIGRATIAGGEVNSAFMAGLESGPTGLALNSEHIYFGGPGLARTANLAGSPNGSSVTVKQAGNRPTPLVFKITGPCVNPSIVRKSDGARLALAGTVASGNFVEVTAAPRTITLNGTANLLSFLQSSASDWDALVGPPSPREDTFSLTARSATAATLEVKYRSAYA
jgi:hypothetical protein